MHSSRRKHDVKYLYFLVTYVYLNSNTSLDMNFIHILQPLDMLGTF